MEKAKPSKKKAYYKKADQGTAQSGKNTSNLKSGSNSGANNSRHFDPHVLDDKTSFVKRSLQQPTSRLADLDEIWQDTHVGQDFETLVNAPLSADGHFIFKSEKNWTLDSSKYDDFFTVDIKDLATIIQCIPYNQYVQVDNKYFTKDELTDINNTAEKGKKAYYLMLEETKQKIVERANEAYNSQRNSSREDYKNVVTEEEYPREEAANSLDMEEDLEFLLSLKEPVRTHPVSLGSTTKNTEETKPKNLPVATKSIDLEKWLDLVLDD
ncbi:uncharacterized protein Aven [Venturia canescens]|uniref:uncharacterized protein Aven n=1 Tax=Venturia canescens TaxID=32260 RepID=UPI001C9BF9BF|nr:uncharacterized protein LOC122416331 [Venturia canescens]